MCGSVQKSRQARSPRDCCSDALNAVPVFGRKILESESGESQELGLGEQLTRCLKGVLRALKEYVEKYHSTGLTWASDAKRSAHPGAGTAAAALSTDTEKTGYAAVSIVSEFDVMLRERVVPVVETCYALDDADLIAAADCVQVRVHGCRAGSCGPGGRGEARAQGVRDADSGDPEHRIPSCRFASSGRILLAGDRVYHACMMKIFMIQACVDETRVGD